MRRFIFSVVCIGLVFSMLAVTFGTANAANNGLELPDPTVDSISGDQHFKVKLLGTAYLPGVTSLESGMLIPAGFPSGEKQFEGSGLKVSGLVDGSATACFPFTGTQYGWGGQVGMWDGINWQLLPTSITTPAESRISFACTTVTKDGYYTFIKWVADRTKLPITVTPKPACGYDIQGLFITEVPIITNLGDRVILEFHSLSIITDGSQNLDGKTITVSARNIIPAGSMIFPPVTGVLQKIHENQFTFSISPNGQITQFYNLSKATFVFDFGYCEDTIQAIGES